MAKGRGGKKRVRAEEPSSPPGASRGEDGGRGAGLDPRWLPPVLYTVMALFLFRSFVFSDEMLLGTDTLGLGYMARLFFAEALRAGDFPLWNPQILGGTPFLESVAGGDSLYPPSLILLWALEPYRALGWKLVLHLPVAGLGMYAWVRGLGRSRSASLLAGLAFTLAPYMITLVYPGQDGKLFVTALTPWVFLAAEGVIRRGGALSMASLALAVGLVILTTHFQMAYFLFGAVGIYALFRAVQVARGPRSPAVGGLRYALFLAAALLGAGLSAVQLLPSVEYVTEHSRRTATTTQASPEEARAYSASWSLHPEEIVSLAVPEFVGNSAGGAPWTTDTYWGRNVFKLNHEYIGLLVLVLAGLSFLGAPDRGLRWFFVGLGGVVLLFTLGAHTPVWRLFYEVVPGIRLFRAPSMAIFLAGFSATTLMAYGVDRALDLEDRRALLRYFGGWLGVLGLFTVLAATGALYGLWTTFLYPEMDPAKAQALEAARPFIVRGGFLALVLSAGLGALLWLRTTGALKPVVVVAGLAGLLTLDLARVDLPFIQTLDFREWAAPNAHEAFLVEARDRAEEPFRVLSFLGNGQDVRPGMFGLDLAAGHHPNDLARYRELIGMEGSGAPLNFFNPQGTGLNANLFTLLNVRYLLWPDFQFGSLGLEPVTRLNLRDGSPYTSLYPIPGWQSRAWLVEDVEVVDPGTAVDRVLDPGFDPAGAVVLEETPDPAWGLGDPPDPSDTLPSPPPPPVRWVERGTDRMVLAYESPEPALLVVSQNWLPGWEAELNGQARPVLRANHTLQAVPVPAGAHQVTLRYRPAPVFRSAAISGLALALILVLGGWGWMARRRSREAPG